MRKQLHKIISLLTAPGALPTAPGLARVSALAAPALAWALGLAWAMAPMGAFAQAAADTAAVAAAAERELLIDEHIAEGGVTAVEMPAALRERLRPEAGKAAEQAAPATAAPASGRAGGYRIQIFSAADPRTAKNEARTRARNVEARFAEYPTYVEYKAPYWRTRVGNFRTSDEAEQAADEIKAAFPAYAREIRVVRDRIVVGD